MDKKYLTPLFFVALGSAFMFVAAVLYFKKGRSAKWTARKMRIGALLLTLGSFSACNGDGGQVSCYVVAAEDDIEIKNALSGELSIDVDSTRSIEGYIYGLQSDTFSYALYDTNATQRLAAGNIEYRIQSSDSSSAEFNIDLDQSIDTGRYIINFYNLPVAYTDSAYHIDAVNLHLIKN